MATPSSESIDALNRAVQAAGSQTKMGRLLGVSQMAVSRWARGKTDLPAEHVLAVEAATGVSRHELRPDIYPPEPGPDHARADLEPAR